MKRASSEERLPRVLRWSIERISMVWRADAADEREPQELGIEVFEVGLGEDVAHRGLEGPVQKSPDRPPVFEMNKTTDEGKEG